MHRNVFLFEILFSKKKPNKQTNKHQFDCALWIDCAELWAQCSLADSVWDGNRDQARICCITIFNVMLLVYRMFVFPSRKVRYEARTRRGAIGGKFCLKLFYGFIFNIYIYIFKKINFLSQSDFGQSSVQWLQLEVTFKKKRQIIFILNFLEWNNWNNNDSFTNVVESLGLDTLMTANRVRSFATLIFLRGSCDAAICLLPFIRRFYCNAATKLSRSRQCDIVHRRTINLEYCNCWFFFFFFRQKINFGVFIS